MEDGPCLLPQHMRQSQCTGSDHNPLPQHSQLRGAGQSEVIRATLVEDGPYLPQSEVIRATLMEDGPCCITHCRSTCGFAVQDATSLFSSLGKTDEMLMEKTTEAGQTWRDDLARGMITPPERDVGNGPHQRDDATLSDPPTCHLFGSVTW